MNDGTTIYFKPPEPPAAPSLSMRLGLDGRIRFLHQRGFWIATEDNDPEPIEVFVAVKRRSVVLDAPERRPLFGVRPINVQFA